MTPLDEAAEPLEMCLRCRGAGCDFCDGEGQVPYGAQRDEDEPDEDLPPGIYSTAEPPC